MSVSSLVFSLCDLRLIQSLFKYPICHPSWTEYLPRSEAILPSTVITHFSETYRLYPPTLAPAAILNFLTLVLRTLAPAQGNHAGRLSLRSPATPSVTRRSKDLDTDWYRCINLGQSDRCKAFSGTYVLGSVEGVWEGVFTVRTLDSWLVCLIGLIFFPCQYTEFSAYSFLLSGGAPPVLNHCLVANHRQTWKLREYYLTEHQERAGETSRPLGLGDPLKAHFPTGTRIMQELSDSVGIQEPGMDVIRYWRPSRATSDDRKVVDIIILGEVLLFPLGGCGFTNFFRGSLCLGPVQPVRSRASAGWLD